MWETVIATGVVTGGVALAMQFLTLRSENQRAEGRRKREITEEPLKRIREFIDAATEFQTAIVYAAIENTSPEATRDSFYEIHRIAARAVTALSTIDNSALNDAMQAYGEALLLITGELDSVNNGELTSDDALNQPGFQGIKSANTSMERAYQEYRRST